MITPVLPAPAPAQSLNCLIGFLCLSHTQACGCTADLHTRHIEVEQVAHGLPPDQVRARTPDARLPRHPQAWRVAAAPHHAASNAAFSGPHLWAELHAASMHVHELNNAPVQLVCNLAQHVQQQDVPTGWCRARQRWRRPPAIQNAHVILQNKRKLMTIQVRLLDRLAAPHDAGFRTNPAGLLSNAVSRMVSCTQQQELAGRASRCDTAQASWVGQVSRQQGGRVTLYSLSCRMFAFGGKE